MTSPVSSSFASEALRGLGDVLAKLADQAAAIDQGGAWLLEALRGGRKILTCGNGGSAADAMHVVEELLGCFRNERVALPAMGLASDPTTLTCIANDFGYQEVFARQVAALGAAGDVLVG